MSQSPGVPLRLRKRLLRLRPDGILFDEGVEWDSIVEEYRHTTEYGSPEQYLDSYLATCEQKKEKPTPARYRTWLLNGERMAREREVAETRRSAGPPTPQTAEEIRKARWNAHWVEQF